MESIREHVETVFAAAAFAERGEPQEAARLLEEAARLAAVQARSGRKAARSTPVARAE